MLCIVYMVATLYVGVSYKFLFRNTTRLRVIRIITVHVRGTPFLYQLDAMLTSHQQNIRSSTPREYGDNVNNTGCVRGMEC